jgi:chorismate synthase
MREEVDQARGAGETLGGVFCVVAVGVPPGLGSYVQWDRKLDGRLAQAVCSIHAVKGVQIGGAFAIARLRGTQAQDPIALEEGAVVRTSNHAGGLEAGVTNGEPIVLLAAMKPLSSVRAPISSVDFLTGAPADPPYVRSDVCSVPSAAVVGEAMVAWVLASSIIERFGSDRLDVVLETFRSLAQPGHPGAMGRAAAREEVP